MTVPGHVPGQRCWARALSRIDPGGDSGRSMHGAWLDRGGVYELCSGLFVVTAEKLDGRHASGMHLTLWRVDQFAPHGLEQVKTWSRKTPVVGRSILTWIARRLEDAPKAADHYGLAHVQTAPRPNRTAGTCWTCRQHVPARAGVLTQTPHGTRVQHADGTCPPLRNTWGDDCLHCGGWVEPGRGVLVDITGMDVDPTYTRDGFVGIRTGQYRAAHDGTCPERPAPRPPEPPRQNSRPGLCVRCAGQVEPGDGLLHGVPGAYHVTHRGECPPHPLNPDDARVWWIDEVVNSGVGLLYDWPAGTVVRTTVPITDEHLPGVSIVGAVVAARSYRRCVYGSWLDALTTVWRVATVAEAAPVLDGEAQRLESARLLGRARQELALHPATVPADARILAEQETSELHLVGLPSVSIPLGADTEVLAVIGDDVVWTVIRNVHPFEWSYSNWGGSTVVSHPATTRRSALLSAIAENLQEP